MLLPDEFQRGAALRAAQFFFQQEQPQGLFRMAQSSVVSHDDQSAAGTRRSVCRIDSLLRDG